MPRKQDCPQRLRALREAHGLSKSALARRCGLPRERVSMLELGKALPSAQTLIALAQAMNVSTDWLLGLRDTPEVGGIEELISYAGQLSPANLAWFVGLAKTLVEEQRQMQEQVEQWKQAV